MVKSKSFYLAIFNLIKQGKSPSFISKEFNIPKQNLYYYTKRLLKEQIIGKHKNGEWYVKVKDFSLGTRPTTNLHALQIHIPISSGNIRVNGWEVRERLRNWTPTYKVLDIFGGLTIKNNNNKSISVFAHTRDLKDINEVDILSKNIVHALQGLFWQDFQVKLDIDRAEVKMLHLATEDKQSEPMRKKGEGFELDLDKRAEKVFKPDKIQGKAWIDGSPFNFTAETNDKEWKRAYLSMPFTIRDTLQAVHYIAKNYASHVGIVEKLNKLLEVKEVKKHIRSKISGRQTKLGDFLWQ